MYILFFIYYIYIYTHKYIYKNIDINRQAQITDMYRVKCIYIYINIYMCVYKYIYRYINNIYMCK